jgi:hypothetical protein
MALTLDKRALRYAPNGHTSEQVQEARLWLMDCEWANVTADDIRDMSTLVILRNVDRHYSGGWSGFVADLTPLIITH